MFFKGPNLKDIELPETFDTELTKKVVGTEKFVFIVKAIIGFIGIVVGMWFSYLGIATASDFKFTFNGAGFEMSKAYPGMVLFVLGFILLLSSRINVKITK